MSYKFESLTKLVDLRGKTKHNGSYTDYGVNSKTDIAIHHSLTTEGSSSAFANYHVGDLGWPGVAYHFVILKNGTIEWNHNPGIKSYHVGNSNRFALGICVVGDFRKEKPTDAQKVSLVSLVAVLKSDLPNYKRTRGHNEFPGYAWKACPVFDYRSVLNRVSEVAHVPAKPMPNKYVIQEGDTFYSIAKENGDLTADAIIKANPGVNPGALKIGQSINMPKVTAPVKPAPPRYPGAIIKEGANGENVKKIQRVVGATVDGNFGPKTTAKVKAWQRAHKLTDDGRVGPASWGAMF